MSDNPASEIGPSAGSTGADLRSALTGAEPPDEAFAVTIDEAISVATSGMTIDDALPDAGPTG